jgi:lipopolysaccharide export system permease protein
LACIDRYILRVCLISTIFVALSLVAIIFLSQSLRFLDLVLAAGAPTAILWQLTLLALPRFLEAVLPLSVMAACIFVYNRLSQDSELAVIQSSGVSPVRIARPAIVVAVMCVLVMLFMTAWAAPMANTTMKQMREQLKSRYSSILLREGVFHKMSNNLTVYINRRQPDGALAGIVIHDAGDTSRAQRTIVARSGQLKHSSHEPRSIVIEDGNRQHYNKKMKTLSQLSFQRYTLELPDGRDETDAHVRDADERTLQELISMRGTVTDKDSQTPDRRALQVEIHRRIASPFMALSFTLIGLCPFLLAPVARRGYSKRIMLAVTGVVCMQGLYLGAFNMARDVDNAYYSITIAAMYFIVFAPMLAAMLVLLWRSDKLPGLRFQNMQGAT